MYKRQAIDSAEVVHGLFKMKGKVDSVMMVTLYMGDEGIMPLVLEDGKIEVSISNTQLTAKGTLLNNQLYEFIDKRNELEVKIEELDRKEARMVLEGEMCIRDSANTLITEPDLLILDEPTNHLDLDMTEWLEEYLRRNNLSLLMVTHDRYFLDRVCAEIVEIDNRQIYQYKGNYSYYLEKRQERIEAKTVEVELSLIHI